MAPLSILVPHDGSRLAGSVVAVLEPLLDGASEITILHVVGDPANEKYGADELDEAERRLSARGASVRRREVRSGDPAGAIVDTAAELGVDLVVMSTHGRTGVERWIRGSVAERVVRHCPVSMLVVNPFCVTDSAGPVRSVLLPLDGSETSEVVLDSLIPLARSHGLRLTLLFVDWEDPTLTPEGARKRRENRERDIAEWLSGAKARLEEAGLPVEIRIAHGDVAQEVLRLAVAGGEYDLVAMGTHGRSGPGRWLLGSIAEKVLRECRLPVLLARKASSD